VTRSSSFSKRNAAVTAGDGNPRPPDWRWLRAQELLHSRGRPTKAEDHHVRQAHEYLKWRRRAHPIRDEAPRRFWEVEDAHGLREQRNWLLRVSLEAAALSGRYREVVARSHAVPIGALVTYEALFFDVRGRLDDCDFIQEHVVRPGLDSGREQEPLAALLKALAYEFGWEVFEGARTPLVLFMGKGLLVRSGPREAELRLIGAAVRDAWEERCRKSGPAEALDGVVPALRHILSTPNPEWSRAVRALQAELAAVFGETESKGTSKA